MGAAAPTGGRGGLAIFSIPTRSTVVPTTKEIGFASPTALGLRETNGTDAGPPAGGIAFRGDVAPPSGEGRRGDVGRPLAEGPPP